MIQKITVFTKIIYFCVSNYFLSTNEKKYIQFNKKQWNKKNKVFNDSRIHTVKIEEFHQKAQGLKKGPWPLFT